MQVLVIEGDTIHYITTYQDTPYLLSLNAGDQFQYLDTIYTVLNKVYVCGKTASVLIKVRKGI